MPNAVPQVAPNTQSAPYITHAVTNSANYNPPRQPSNMAQSASHHNYQSNPPYRGYQKVNDKVLYQVDKDSVNDQPQGFYTIFGHKGNEITYLNKDFDEIAVKFGQN